MDLEGLPHTYTDIEVQPFQFEPISVSKNDRNTDDESSISQENSDDPDPDDREMEEEAEPLDCITQHEGFSVNFTNIHVLQLALLEFVSLAGPQDDKKPIHKTYRYVAYRRFTRWIHGRLRKHERRPILSGVVPAIRKHFPSEEVAGFKYYRPS
ncbi:uncharacterized protein [Haliotis cracherodii]|uniref:uncharacterized protein n=1 Tax=Haliotis cracherodii TaxID=6455 RepID=UPI0039E920A4